MQPVKKLGGESLAFSKDLQPRLPPSLACGSLGTDQIALAHDPYRRPIVIDDRHCGDAFVQHQPGDLAQWCVGMHRHNGFTHDIACIHCHCPCPCPSCPCPSCP